MKHRAGFKTNAPNVLLPHPHKESCKQSRSRGAVSRVRVLLNLVIASVSEAIQSLAHNLDCFVATAPRNGDYLPVDKFPQAWQYAPTLLPQGEMQWHGNRNQYPK